jgi:hypothetical protein
LRSLLSQAGQMVNLRMEGGKEKRTDRETAWRTVCWRTVNET